MNNGQTVFIVDDDPGVRQSLSALARSMELDSEDFGSAIDFLDVFDPMRSGCLLLDVCLPGMSGLELLEHINHKGICIAAIVISAHGDVPTVVRAMRAGAINYLEKPCRDELICEAIQEGFKWDAANRRRIVQLTRVCRRLDHLAPGEYDVLERIMEGKSNKNIAADLCVSVRTVEVRRSKLMKKMRAHSLAELIRMTTLTSYHRPEAEVEKMKR